MNLNLKEKSVTTSNLYLKKKKKRFGTWQLPLYTEMTALF